MMNTIRRKMVSVGLRIARRQALAIMDGLPAETYDYGAVYDSEVQSEPHTNVRRFVGELEDLLFDWEDSFDAGYRRRPDPDEAKTFRQYRADRAAEAAELGEELGESDEWFAAAIAADGFALDDVIPEWYYDELRKHI